MLMKFLNPLALGDVTVIFVHAFIFKLTIKLGSTTKTKLYNYSRFQVILFYTNQISTWVLEVRENVQFQ